MNTGTTISGRPSMGSWLDYGLGCEADDLPGFCVLTSSGRSARASRSPKRQWHSGFLPSRHQGIHLRGTGDPVLYLTNPPGVDPIRQRQVIDAVQDLNRLGDRTLDDPEIATRISQYEMAYRMQTSVPRLRDFTNETRETMNLYGIQTADGSFGANCLMARRLAEQGVPFQSSYIPPRLDHHGSVRDHMRGSAGEVDQAAAGLVKDLKKPRHARRDADRLRRRVRPDADGPGQRPRPPHQGLLDVARRRRHPARHHSRSDRRLRLQRGREHRQRA